jgi:hypothetical protein
MPVCKISDRQAPDPGHGHKGCVGLQVPPTGLACFDEQAFPPAGQRDAWDDQAVLAEGVAPWIEPCRPDYGRILRARSVAKGG